MKKKRLVLLILVAMTALVFRSDGQQTQPVADQLKLASVMPKGALVYVQASDLAALMKTWLASSIRSNFYGSASFAAFEKSRIYLKLQDRKKDFDTAIGVGLDESRLGELAGRASAVSIYDIGKIELVLSPKCRGRELLLPHFSNKLRSFRSVQPTASHITFVTLPPTAGV